MTTVNERPPRDQTSTERGRLSKDGQWRSFSKVSNLLQYVPNANYYARIKVHGKVIRRSLDTSVFTTAKLRLLDFLRKQQQHVEQIPVALTFREVRELYEQRLANDPATKARTKWYRQLCLGKLKSTWPGIDDRKVNEITVDQCREWAARLDVSGHYINNTTGTLRQILDLAVREHKTRGLASFDNPALEISRARVTQSHLVLPEPDQFKALVDEIRTGSGARGTRISDLVQFLAYSGLRAFSEAAWVTWADIDWTRHEIIVRGDPASGTKNSEIRRVPILPDMEVLLTRLKEAGNGSGKILEVRRCPRALTRACAKLGIHRITHHDLRHLFATRCIESGVDIPTVSRWLGHKDGGALAMKVYGHLRNQHSQEMAAKVKF